MDPKRNVLHHLLIAMVAVNISFTNSNVINFADGVAGFKAEAEENIKHQLEQAKQSDNSQNGDRKFHWPSSVGITIHRAGEVDSVAAADAEQQLGQHDTEYKHHHNHQNNSANGNDTQNGDRKFHWPSSVGITIHRAGKVDSEAAADAEQQLGQNYTEHNHHHHHHHHHNNSANGNGTHNGDRKFHWPSSVGITIHRAGEVDSVAAADAEQQLGQNDTEHNHHHHHHHHHNNSANGNDTQNGDRKFHWPSSVGITIHRAEKVDSEVAADAEQQLGHNDTEHNHHHHHHHHHNNSANGNDTQNGDRKFHWPSSVGITIHRAEKVDSEVAADAEQQLGHNDTEHNHHHHHHHHHNNSANGNDTQNGDRKFHWPSSVGITIHRAGEVDSEAAADAEQQLGQNDSEHNHLHHHHHHHNNSANGNDTQNGDRKFHWPSSVGITIHRAGKVDSEAASDRQLGQNYTDLSD